MLTLTAQATCIHGNWLSFVGFKSISGLCIYIYISIPLHIGRYDHYFDINSCFYRLRFGSNWSLNTMQLHLIMLPVNSHYFNYFFQSKMFVHFWHYQMSKMIKTLLRASPNYLWPLQSLVPLSQRLLKINRMSQPNKHGTNMNCQYQYLLKGGRSYVNTVLQDTGSETQCSELLQNTEKIQGNDVVYEMCQTPLHNVYKEPA